MNEKEIRVFKRAAAGNKTALNYYMKKFMRIMPSIAKNIALNTNNQASINDLISVGIASIPTAISDYKLDRNMSLSSYVYYRARLAMFKEIRESIYPFSMSYYYLKKDEAPKIDNEALKIVASGECGPDSKSMENEEKELVRKFITDNLNENERKVIRMRFWERKTQKEAANVLGLTRAKVIKINETALKKLSESMRDYGLSIS